MSAPSSGLHIEALDVAIAGTPILRGVGLRIRPGTMVGLIGRNGAGKTTLMRAIMGLLARQQGTIRFNGADLAPLPAHARARLGISYMPEDRRLIPELTVQENILLPTWATTIPDAQARFDWALSLLPEIAEFGDRRALQLSGGQQKLVALARALIPGRHLLLLDEPFEGVAPVLSRRLTEVIGSLRAQGLTVILSESDDTHSADLVDEVFRIERGVVTKG